MANWDDIARENLKASQKLADTGCYRSCVSRSYYAAFSAVTFWLTEKVQFRAGRESPAHNAIVSLVERHLSLPARTMRDFKASIRRLYNERLAADYRSRWTVDERNALMARQDAYKVCRYLGIL